MVITLRVSGSFAQIAQSVERRTENPRVTGSFPVLGIDSGSSRSGNENVKMIKKLLTDDANYDIILFVRKSKHAGVVQW